MLGWVLLHSLKAIGRFLQDIGFADHLGTDQIPPNSHKKQPRGDCHLQNRKKYILYVICMTQSKYLNLLDKLAF